MTVIAAAPPAVHEPASAEALALSELQHLPRIDLRAAMKVDLLSRIDTKVMLDLFQLRQVLANLVSQPDSNYRLVVTPVGAAPFYSSLYFDSPGLQLYRDHHNGRRKRHKIRYRHYSSTDVSFFEVKRRTGPRRTAKTRIQVPEIPMELGPQELELVDSMGIDVTGIEPTLQVVYRRATLVGIDERVTIDLGLSCEARNTQRVDFGAAAILEIKNGGRAANSPIMRSLSEVGIRRGSVSKYCVGIASCFDIKRNRFEAGLRKLENLS
jgi:hypothetical protein